MISGPTERVNALPALTPVTCKEATLADANLYMELDQVKRCTKCGETKPIDLFGIQRGTRRAQCNPCRTLQADSWAKRNPERVRATRREWVAKNRERVRAYPRKTWAELTPEQRARKTARSKVLHLKRTFGITPEDWQHMYEAQGGVCALCRVPGRVGKHGKLQVDHCHETGRIRGLLCGPCNVALGIFGDTVSALERVLRYMKGEDHV